MTDHDLRDLLREQVADVTITPDLSAGAWAAARGVRRRRALVVAMGSAAAAAVVVVAGIAVLGDRASDSTDPAPAPTGAPQLSEDFTPPDGTFRGAPVYWSPSQPEEADLPVMTSGRPSLPEVIDLSAEATPVEEAPIDSATAAFGVSGDSFVRLLLLAPDGTYRTLDLSDLESDPSISCCRRLPVYDWMLSPTGRFVAFPQIDGFQVYDLAEGEWRKVTTRGDVATTDSEWVGERDLFVPLISSMRRGPVYDVVTAERTSDSEHVDTGANELSLEQDLSYEFGQAQTGPAGVLQSWGSGADLPVPDARKRPEFLVAKVDRTTILTFTGSPGGDGRWLQCCPVVGWAADDVAMYESRSATPRIIAWTVGTHTFETVSTITGFTPGEQSYVGSYADFWE